MKASKGVKYAQHALKPENTVLTMEVGSIY